MSIDPPPRPLHQPAIWPEILAPIGRILSAATITLLVIGLAVQNRTSATLTDMVGRQAARIRALETQQRELRLRVQYLEHIREDRI